MERNKESEKPRILTIRFHHLGIFNDVASSFLKDFNSIKPWNLEKDRKVDIVSFVNRFVERDFEGWIAAKNYLEDLALSDDKEAVRRLKYIKDLNGESKADKYFVTWSRKKLFLDFFDIACFDKNYPIDLTVDKDTYCDTCAVGRHCDRTLVQKIVKYDRDYVFRKALISLNKKGSVGNGLIFSKDSNMQITSELIFDKNFYNKLWQEIKDGGDGDWI